MTRKPKSTDHGGAGKQSSARRGRTAPSPDVNAPERLTPSDVRQIGELWDGINEAFDRSPETFKKIVGECKIVLDVRQGQIYGGDRMNEGGKPRMDRFIAYYRVSTKRQGASGLGLEAQRADVTAFIGRTGGEIVRDFQEVESGKRNDRPELTKAVAFARRSGATLLVAKLDRLGRNLAFLAALMESGVEFVCCDNPHANRFTVHILAAVAEHEREMISKRTKAALGQAKARGTALGSARPGHWEGREERRLEGARRGAQAAARVNREQARVANADVAPLIESMHAEGRSLREIAAELNAQGIPTRRGKEWAAATVRNVLNRKGE